MGWALPPTLRARFMTVRQLPTRGAEADVFVVGLADGGDAILKLYRHGNSLADRALDVVSQIDPAHVVKILDWDEVDGRWFELQEYCPLGSLADLHDAGSLPLPEVVAELAQALAALHAAGVVHEDLKPANVLVRTRDPLDLVVCDFGVTKALEGSRRWSTGAGTAEYSPPEAGAGEVSPAWDWWSLGMMTAELAIGRHPLALPDGSMPSFHVIRSHLAQRDIDLSAITDTRTRLLCSGLLTRDTTHRWGHEQVTAWLAGHNPDVVQAEPGAHAQTRGPGRNRVRFAGIEYDTPAGLAAAFAGSWEAAGAALFAERDRTLRDDLTAMLREHSLPSAISTLEAQQSGRPDNALARLLLDMDPQLEPQVDGVSVTPAGAEQIAVAILTAGTATTVQARICSLITDADLLRVWRHLPAMNGAGEAADRTNTITAELADAGFTTLPSGATDAKQRWDQAEPARQAWTILLAVNPTAHQATLAAQLDSCDPAAIPDETWWHTALRNAATPATQIRALIAYPIAVADQNTLDSKRAADHAAAERRYVEELSRWRQGQATVMQRRWGYGIREFVLCSVLSSPLVALAYFGGNAICAAINHVPIPDPSDSGTRWIGPWIIGSLLVGLAFALRVALLRRLGVWRFFSDQEIFPLMLVIIGMLLLPMLITGALFALSGDYTHSAAVWGFVMALLACVIFWLRALMSPGQRDGRLTSDAPPRRLTVPE